MIGGLGVNELLIILLILLVFFGGKKLPELARGLGQGIAGFKSTLHETSTEDEELKKES